MWVVNEPTPGSRCPHARWLHLLAVLCRRSRAGSPTQFVFSFAPLVEVLPRFALTLAASLRWGKTSTQGILGCLWMQQPVWWPQNRLLPTSGKLQIGYGTTGIAYRSLTYWSAGDTTSRNKPWTSGFHRVRSILWSLFHLVGFWSRQKRGQWGLTLFKK